MFSVVAIIIWPHHGSVATDGVAWSVCMCVLVTAMSPAKIDLLAEIPLWVFHSGGPRNHVLVGAQAQIP